MKRVLFGLFLTFGLSTQVAFGAGGALFKFIGDSLFVNEKLSKGVNSYINRSVVRSNIEIGLENFSKKKGSFTLEGLESRKYFITDSADMKLFEDSIAILKKDRDSVTSDELVELGNNLAFLSQRYGYRKAGILSCGNCADIRLAQDKILYKLESLKTDAHKHIYKRVISRKKTPEEMNAYIREQLSEQGLGSLSHIAKHEEELLATFVSIPKYRDGKTKMLAPVYDAVVNVSTVKGGVDLFDKKNNHKLWTILPKIKTVEDANQTAALLNLTAVKMKQEGKGTMKALREVLQEGVESESNPKIKLELQAEVDKFFRLNCLKQN